MARCECRSAVSPSKGGTHDSRVEQQGPPRADRPTEDEDRKHGRCDRRKDSYGGGRGVRCAPSKGRHVLDESVVERVQVDGRVNRGERHDQDNRGAAAVGRSERASMIDLET
jgi:hypothetical protein